MHWYMWAAAGLLLALAISAPFTARRLRELKLNRAGLGDAALMTDDAMRLHMVRLFGAMGYRVFRPSPEQQSGFDLVLLDGLGQKRGVLLSEWRRPVDESVVSKAAAAAEALGGATSMIVTIEYYTYKARREAERTGTILWSLGDLTRAIGQVQRAAAGDDQLQPPEPQAQARRSQQALELLMEPAASREAVQESPWGTARSTPGEGSGWLSLAEGGAPKCPRCGKKMLIKRSSRGSYWGCRAFPRCLGTLKRD